MPSAVLHVELIEVSLCESIRVWSGWERATRIGFVYHYHSGGDDDDDDEEEEDWGHSFRKWECLYLFNLFFSMHPSFMSLSLSLSLSE